MSRRTVLAYTKGMAVPHESDYAARSERLEAEIDRACEQFATARDAEPRRMALEKMLDVVAEMEVLVCVIVDPGVRPN